MKGKIAITLSSFSEDNSNLLSLLKEKGFEVVLNSFGRKLDRIETLELCSNCVGIVAGTEMYDSDILDKLSRVKVISRCGVGIDNIDFDVAKRLGIKVLSVSDVPTLAVAELTVGLILNLLRKVNQMDAAMRNGKWEKMMGNLLCYKKVGIIGFGRIGKKVAELLRPFNCEIAYADPFVDDRLLGLKRLAKEDLLKWFDIITIHVSGKDKIIGRNEFELMKKGSWIINTSRGVAIDELTLYEYLKNGHISGAALDVFRDEPYNGPLRELDNVILTPHIGSYAKEARIKMEIEAVKNLLSGLGK